MKQHIINGKSKLYVCGNRHSKGNATAFFEDGILYDNDCNPITFDRLHVVCKNCLKKADYSYLKRLLMDSQMEVYRQSIPKTMFAKKRRNAKNRINRNDAFKGKYRNVIELPYIPVAITDPHRLIEYHPLPTDDKCVIVNKPKSNAVSKNDNDPIIELNDLIIEPIDDDSIYGIDFGEGLMMIKGFNKWMIVIEDNGNTESLSDWIDYQTAYKECMELANVNNQTNGRKVA